MYTKYYSISFNNCQMSHLLRHCRYFAILVFIFHLLHCAMCFLFRRCNFYFYNLNKTINVYALTANECSRNIGIKFVLFYFFQIWKIMFLSCLFNQKLLRIETTIANAGFFLHTYMYIQKIHMCMVLTKNNPENTVILS